MTLHTPPAGTHGNRTMSRPLARLGARMMAAWYRRSDRMASTLLLLSTVGATSGKQRVTPVGYTADGADRWLIVASDGGSAKNPGWLHNLAEHPDQVSIEIGHDKVNVQPEILAGDERAAAWATVVAATPQYGKYETQTDREISVVRLTRAP